MPHCLLYLFFLIDFLDHLWRGFAFERFRCKHKRPLMASWPNVLTFQIFLCPVLVIISWNVLGGTISKVNVGFSFWTTPVFSLSGAFPCQRFLSVLSRLFSPWLVIDMRLLQAALNRVESEILRCYGPFGLGPVRYDRNGVMGSCTIGV